MSEFQNYFNYFTEIEEHFQKARGTSLFLLSPLDWALIESWRSSGVPLEAVLRGIDAAFEKWRGRRSKTQQVNSLAFCSQAVLTEAQRAPAGAADAAAARNESDEALDRAEIGVFLRRNQAELQVLEGYGDIAGALNPLMAEAAQANLEELDGRLTILEQKMIAIARTKETEADALAAKRELEIQLQPYRRKMTGPQLAMLERQFLERKLLQRSGLPRLSLFYLR